MHLSRRALFGSAAAILFAACGAPPPTQAPKPVEPAKAAEAAKPAAPADAAKPIAKAAPTPAPTPTLPPVFTPVPQAPGTTKLLMRVHWAGSSFNEFQKIINDYNATQGTKDKIYINLERFVAGQAGPIATFIADFQAGTQEDIYHLGQNNLADLAARNFFSAPTMEVQNYIKQNFLDPAVRTGTWEGKIMGYPTENQPHMLFGNTKMFQAAGLDANKDMPKKWDDIRRVAKATTKVEGGTKTQAGFIVHYQNGERITVQRLMFQFVNGAPLVDLSKTPPVWDVKSDGARAWTELMANMYADNSLSADLGPDTITWPQRKGNLISHDAFAVWFRLVTAGQPGILEEQFTAPLYSADGTKTGNMARNYHFLVSSKSKEKDLSWLHLKWMNEGPEFRMQNFQTHVFGFVASVKNYELPKFFPAQMKTAFQESISGPNQTIMPVAKGMNEVFNIFRDNHDALVFGKVTAAEYTAKVDEELKRAMSQAYG